MSEASCTVVLLYRACLANKKDRTDGAALAPFTFTGPSLAWSPHIRIPSAQTNRNIRLKVISEIMLYYRNVAIIFAVMLFLLCIKLCDYSKSSPAAASCLSLQIK